MQRGALPAFAAVAHTNSHHLDVERLGVTWLPAFPDHAERVRLMPQP